MKDPNPRLMTFPQIAAARTELRLVHDVVFERNFTTLRRASDDGQNCADTVALRELLTRMVDSTRSRMVKGDPFYVHPTIHSGISNGEVALAHELVTGVPWRVNITRRPGQTHVAVHAFLAGPNFAGKTNALVVVARQIARLGMANILALDRKDQLVQYLGNDAGRFKVLRWEELRFNLFARKELLGPVVELLTRVYERKDSTWVLLDVVTSLVQKRTEQNGGFVNLDEVIRELQSASFGDYKSRDYARTWARILTDLSFKTKDLFTCRKPMDMSKLLGTNLILLLGSLLEREARLLTLYLFLLLSAEYAGLPNDGCLRTVLVWDEAQLALSKTEPLVAERFPTIRHDGVFVVANCQNPSEISRLVIGNCTLLVQVGPLMGDDFRDFMSEMNVVGLDRFRIGEWSRSMAPGVGIAMHRSGPFPAPFPIRFPKLNKQPMLEDDRLESTREFLAQLNADRTEHAAPPCEILSGSSQAAAPQPQDRMSQEDLVERFLRLAASDEHCFTSLAEKYLTLGVRSREKQASIVCRCEAQGLVKVPVREVLTGNRGRRMKLFELTELALKRYNLKSPLRQNESAAAQYYAHRIFQAVRALGDRYIPVLQGQVGKDLKRVDVLIRDNQDDRFIAVEIACPGDRHEAFNLIADLADPLLVKRLVIVAEDEKVKRSVLNDIAKAPCYAELQSRILIETFTVAIKDLVFCLKG